MEIPANRGSSELRGMGPLIETLGLATALQAKIPADRIVNFMSVLDLKSWAEAVREGRARKQQI